MKILKREKKKTRLELAQEKAQAAVNRTNKKIEKLGEHAGDLYEALTKIQNLFDRICNVPSETKLEYEELKKIRVEWKQQVEKIDADYKRMVKNAGKGAAVAGAGVAVAAMGPTAAMGVATTFGVASTGTAIATLSGAAQLNAALAWLGGGAVVINGGGMVAGRAFLKMFGPVGWGIAGAAMAFSGFMFLKGKNDQKRIEDIYIAISERDVASYHLAIVELNERITRIVDETKKLNGAIDHIKLMGTDYTMMTEQQQYALGAYVNFMNTSTQLLVNPIKGLMPKYSEADLEKFIAWKDRKARKLLCIVRKDAIIGFANLLYKIDLDDHDQVLLWKVLRKNKEVLEAIDIEKEDFDIQIMDTVLEALLFKYGQ